MAFKLTQQAIQNWGGMAVFAEAEALMKRGSVLRADYQPPWLEGEIVRDTGELRTRAKVNDSGIVENKCPCYASREQGLVCCHVVALALTVLRRTTDPLREQKYLEEQRRAKRMAESTNVVAYLRFDANGTPAALLITVPATWQQDFQRGEIALGCALLVQNRIVPMDQIDRNRAYKLTPADENLLTVLDDICGGPTGGRITMKPPDFLNVLELRRNTTLAVTDGTALTVNATPMRMLVRLDLDRENGELLVNAHTELPFMRASEFPAYFVSGRKGWALGAGHLWPLENVLPLPYHAIYQAPIVITRPDVLRFLQAELPELQKAATVESEITPDIFSSDPATPVFQLTVRGSPASLAAELKAVYANRELAAAGPAKDGGFALPDPTDILHYFTRNKPAEERALARLSEGGFRGPDGGALEPLAGTREVLNFLGSQIPALRRLGWKVHLDGKVAGFHEGLAVATPVVHVAETGEGGWFDVGFEFEAPGGSKLTPAEIQRALNRGDAFLERDGQTVLLDRDAIESMRGVFSDCNGRESDRAGFFRLPSVYAPYVRSSLTALDGVDIEEPPNWRDRATRQNRELKIEPVPLGDPLENILRPYQKEGVYWLRFLEKGNVCGLLADEMGLGKTLQTLTWLQLERADPEARGQPALIVCPTSLVENWAREAQQFTPKRKVLVISGSKRHDLWNDVAKSDIVVTSYALLRRDIEYHLAHNYSVAVLDEAQHIKNRSTQNALAVKQIRAVNKLVLTGTPVENGVADIWSIMDFLMPSYLGDYELFRAQYEMPIAGGDRDGEIAQAKLRRKLHPFLLRRLKRDVAKDLPEKLIKTSFCVLSSDQQAVYNAILQESRRRIGNLVAEKGFERCRIEILAILMKLRQICCHLELLKDPELLTRVDAPSAKMEQFFEILDEAMDGGHRVLVFSQFVSMLQILRREMEARKLPYCYLDGQSKDRMTQVQRFNLQHDIPAFLISLKAGGTGLNLTGADMVVHFDPWWNPAVEDQATDRAHRIGQKRTVYSIKLIAEHTVEEKVLALQRKKQAVIAATISTGDEAIMQSLSWNDIKDLLEI